MKSELIWKDISKLKPAPYNPRDISQEALEGLRHSIRKFKMPQPIVENKRTGLIVGGHKRLEAAKLEGWKKVPVIQVDLSPEDEEILNATLNNPRIQGFYTDDLGPILEKIKLSSPDDFINLKLDEIFFDDDWKPDMENLDKIAESDEGILATIKILCPTEEKSKLLDLIKISILESGIQGVEVT